MSASKKHKSSETATDILHPQQDTENINNTNNRFRKTADFFGPSTSSAAAAAQSNPAGSGAGRTALGQQNTNSSTSTGATMQRSGSNTNVNSYSNTAGGGNDGGGSGGIGTNGERRANFSMLDTTAHLNDHRSSTTTSAFFNKMGANNASKPGDVKKIVIKNFKGKVQCTNLGQMNYK